jgi:putative ABC transport system permease protein
MDTGRNVGGGKGMSVLRRVTGMRGAGSLALALLAGGCVLAATVGPRQAQATGAQALQQTLARAPSTEKTIVASSNWGLVNSTIQPANSRLALQNLTGADVNNVTAQLRRDFSAGPLPLSPPSTDWFGMTADPSYVTSPLPSLHGVTGKLEVVYRYPAAGNLRLVAGRMPDTTPQPTVTRTEETFNIPVVVTPQTASRFALRPGSTLTLAPPVYLMVPGQLATIHLDVTGIVEPVDPGSSFWDADYLLPGPELSETAAGKEWDGAVIADPGELEMVQQIFGGQNLVLQWEFPTGLTGAHGQASALYNHVNQIVSQTPRLTGQLAPMSNALTVSSGLLQPLAAFVQTADNVNVLIWIIYAGLAVAGIVTLLLAARMIAARRSAELSLHRARGASLWQLFRLAAGGAVVACVPAAALAWVIAVLLVPGATPAGSAAWLPGVATLAIAAIGPGLVAAWQHRLPRRRNTRRRWSWLPRVVFEVTVGAAAVGGIVVFRAQTGATDLFTSTAPVLVAVPAVIVALRLYQVLLRGLARASARRRGIIGFLALSRAAQAPVMLALPALTLVLALTVAAFTGMVQSAVFAAETAASWQATGADVVVTAPIQLGLSPSAVRAIAAVPGVEHAVPADRVAVTTANGVHTVTVIVVDPASYAALVASTEGFSPVRPALLSQPRGQGAIPVLASPQAVAYLGGRAGSTIFAQQGLPTLHVRVSGELQSTPALPGGGAFIVLPMSAIVGASGPLVNLMLLTGPSINLTRLKAAVQATTPGASAPTVTTTGSAPVQASLTGAQAPAITTRSATLQALTEAPLQQGTFLLFTLAIAFAAALALAVMLLQLALGATDRELTTARLATMGLSEGQRVRLVALEVVPSIAAAAVAAAACAIALPRVLAPTINLSAFTQSPAPTPLRSDFASFLLPLAALVAITIIALAFEVRSGCGRGVAVTMRT